MSFTPLNRALQAAVQSGLLPAGTQAPEQDARPWPVLLLLALGAWLAAVPLLVVVALLLGDFIEAGVGPYLVGVLLLTGSVVVLRSQQLPVFVEQLALPALLVGGGTLGGGLFRDLGTPAAAALLSLLALGVAVAVPRAWLRVLLGAAAALFFGLACMPSTWAETLPDTPARGWLTMHLLLLVWLLAGAGQRRLGPALRAALEPLRGGWLLVAVAGLAGWSGMTMLVGASLGGGIAGLGSGQASGPVPQWQAQTLALQLTSLLLALTAAAWVARAWPTLRQPWCAAAALVLAALAAWLPALGAVLLALAVSVTAGRRLLSAAAALAAAWIVGASYYSLAWSLQDKALALLLAGAVLGALAWWAWRSAGSAPVAAAAAAAAATATAALPPGSDRFARAGRSGRPWGLALSVLGVLAVANVGIWQKEQLIAHGQPVFVQLAPADPRSLMQGDFMTLRFALPAEVRGPEQGLLKSQRPRVLAQRDGQGVATLLPWPAGAVPQTGQLTLELTPKGGQWVLVTDAWFFAEGQGERWAAARYGEFRVDGQGRALLVGLRGAELKPL